MFLQGDHVKVQFEDKKVLLRERKRHTTRPVASARCAALSNGGEGGTPFSPGRGGYPHHPDLAWVPPTIQTWLRYLPTIQTWPGGYSRFLPHHPDLAGVPPSTIQTWPGGYPRYPHHPDLTGVPPTIQTWLWYPPPCRSGLGVPQGTPTIQTWLGYPHHPDLTKEPPPHRPDLAGIPLTIQTWMGYPTHHSDLAEVPPTIQTWPGYPPHHPDLARVPPPPFRPGWGTPPLWCELTNKLKTVPSPILRMRAVKMCQEKWKNTFLTLRNARLSMVVSKPWTPADVCSLAVTMRQW